MLRKQDCDTANKTVKTVAQLEAQLQESRKALQFEKTRSLEELRREHERELGTQRAEYQDQLERVHREHDEVLAETQKTFEQIRQENRIRLETLRAEHTEDFDARENEFAESLDQAKSEYRQDLAEIKNEHESLRREIGENNTALEVRAAELKTKLEAGQERRTELEGQLKTAAQEGRRAMAEAEKNFELVLEHQRESDRREAEETLLKALSNLKDRMRKEKAEAIASTFEDHKESEAPLREKLESLERERDAWRAEREVWRAELESERESFESRVDEEIELARQTERNQFEDLATKQSGRMAEIEAQAKQLRDKASILETTAEDRQGLIKELEETVRQLRREHAEASAALAFESCEKAKKKDAALAKLREEQQVAIAKWLDEKQTLVDLHRQALSQQTQKYRASLSELEKNHQAALEKSQALREATPMEKVADGAGTQEVLKAEWTAHQKTKKALKLREGHVAQLLERIDVERTQALEAMQTVAMVESEAATKRSQIQNDHTEAMNTLRREFEARAKVLVEFWNEIEDLPEGDDADQFSQLLKELLT